MMATRPLLSLVLFPFAYLDNTADVKSEIGGVARPTAKQRLEGARLPAESPARAPSTHSHTQTS